MAAKSLSQIKTQVRTLISQTDPANSDFTDGELTIFINEALNYTSIKTDWPRKEFTVQLIEGVGNYAAPTDLVRIRNAYIGNASTTNNIYPLALMTEEKVKTRFPSWLDTTVKTEGRPVAIFFKDRTTMFIMPRPDAVASASGSLLIIHYTIYPTPLSADTDTPNIPEIFQDTLKYYAAHLCYMGKLKNPDIGMKMLAICDKNIKEMVELVGNQEGDDMFFGWANFEDTTSSVERIANYIL